MCLDIAYISFLSEIAGCVVAEVRALLIAYLTHMTYATTTHKVNWTFHTHK